ncbi:CHY zinc finger protein [Haloquadratum walsbyi]|uniref:Zinc finger protein n=1 Tax=Haloquadratum walsbyi (strain DSM 16854 / JCM 12705 / C23) TaxID=768065 RepID=G0LMP3_HALWC|nr:zinc finger protein [Haloquadratum walsbyi]CCC41363.1 zinc finger protein [Haloquadratum walsbyi C23]
MDNSPLSQYLPAVHETTGDQQTSWLPQPDDRFAVTLCGVSVDAETRCAHWTGPSDVIALRFGCCEVFSPCYRCHLAVVAHAQTTQLLSSVRSPNDRNDLCHTENGECQPPHEEKIRSQVDPWPAERLDDPAVLCGVCRTTLSARTYLDTGVMCPICGAAFNPGCRQHHALYFETDVECSQS